jgi:hypothetical protein
MVAIAESITGRSASKLRRPRGSGDGVRRSFVLGPVAMTARILGRLRSDQPAADIGIERRLRDREFGGGLAGGKIEPGGFFHIDLHNQD